jgi:hypothetical protein
LLSGKDQTITLELPAGIATITVDGKDTAMTKADSANRRQLMLPAGREVTVKARGN